MPPGEAQRLQLYEQLVKEFGDEPAMTLMESLPPVDWHELATKDDLAALEERVNARFEVVDARFDALRVEVVDARFDALRFEVVDARFDALRVELGARIDTGLATPMPRIAPSRTPWPACCRRCSRGRRAATTSCRCG